MNLHHQIAGFLKKNNISVDYKKKDLSISTSKKQFRNNSANRKSIAWVTGDSFFDCDAFIVPLLIKSYDIKWINIISKNPTFSNEALAKQIMPKVKENISIFNLKYRYRDMRIIFQYICIMIEIRKYNPDFIYINFQGFPYFIPILYILYGSDKVIFASHNTSTPEGAFNMNYMRLYQKTILFVFKFFQVFSQNQLEFGKINFPNKKFFLTSLSMKDYGTSTQKPPDNYIQFLFFGIIREYKRLDLLIKAACNVYESEKIFFKVIVAGKCADWEPYQKLIKYPEIFELHIQSIPDSKIPDLFASSHYFVLPYQDGTQSGAIQVAFNYGVPSIASDIKPFQEIIKNNVTGLLFKNNDLKSLENIIKGIVLGETISHKELKQNLSLFTEAKFSIDKIISNYEEMFRTIKNEKY